MDFLKFVKKVKEQEEWKPLVEENVWFEQFWQNQHFVKENWIDFEHEISNVIRILDDDMEKKTLEDTVWKLTNEYLRDRFLDNEFEVFAEVYSGIGRTHRKPPITYGKLRDLLLGDLNRMTEALEKYLLEQVNQMEITERQKDIEKLEIDKVLSFNYTNTYERVYADGEVEYDYIHGRAGADCGFNNMVLGIDEYLSEERRAKDLEFIAFKKYYQRIYKETGCRYKEWIRELENDTDKSNVYIFGHSLDATDGDILHELITNEHIMTTIYYLNRDVYGRQISNLVKILGTDGLIKRTGGPEKTITFVQQS